MDAKRRREIGEIADGIRESLDLNVPVDIEQAVAMLGGDLKETSITEGEAYVERQEDSFVIGIEPGVAENRRRFSIAHELGHLFLHMGFLLNEAKWATAGGRYEESIRYRFGYSEEEYEAHEFAGAFLMPEKQFREIAERNRQGSKFNVGQIAEYFNVSADAAKTRGRWLQLFSWD